MSKRQSITARSSAEAEIYTIDECVKALQHIRHIFEDLHLDHLLPSTFLIYNDNEASVKWTTNMTNKGLRHIQMQENAICEAVLSGFVTVDHIRTHFGLLRWFTIIKQVRTAGRFRDVK